MIAVIGESALSRELTSVLCCTKLQLDSFLASPPDVRLLVWCREGQNWSRDLQTHRRLRAQPLPFLQIWRQVDELWVGPLERRGEPGCILCLRHRLRAVSMQKERFDEFDRLELAGTDLCAAPFVVFALVGLLSEEASHVAAGRQGLTAEGAWSVTLATGAVRWHPLVPDAACPECGSLPADLPELVFSPGRVLPKQQDRSLRVSAALPDTTLLQRSFVDHRTGIIPNVMSHPDQRWLPVSEAQVALAARDRREAGFGRAFAHDTADAVAVLEALERYAGIHSLSRKSVLTAPYEGLEKDAIDPVNLILHAPEAYSDTTNRLVPYTPSLPLRWIWSYSFMQRRPVLVPEQSVYYGVLPETTPPSRIIYDTSNGCALGGSLEEAIFYGLLEVIERDAALLYWHATLPAARLDLHQIRIPAVWDLAERALEAGYQVDVFNVTTEVRVPTVMTVAWRPDGRGPFASVAGGANPDPIKAIAAGVAEAVAGIHYGAEIWQEQGHASTRVRQPKQVRTLEDHRLRMMLPDAREWLGYLLDNRRSQTIQEAWGMESWPANADFQQDLSLLVQRVLAAGLDVLAVDQTPPELKRIGLYAARVLVPGMLPLTFGHDLRRVDEDGRAMTVPSKLGFSRPTRLNLAPHPLC